MTLATTQINPSLTTPPISDDQTEVVTLWEHQLEAMSLHPSILSLTGGTGTGKTHFAGFKMADEMVRIKRLWKWLGRTDRIDFMVISPSFPMHERNMVNDVIPFLESLRWGHYKTKEKEFVIDDRTSIWFLSGENPKALEGLHAAFGWLDEPGQSDPMLWQILKRRTARASKIGAWVKDEIAIANGHPEGEWITAGNILLTGYPLSSEGWFNDEVHVPATDEDPAIRDSSIIELAWKSEDAPGYNLEFLKKEKARIPRWQYEQLYEGKFTRPSESIYPKLRIVDREEAPPLESLLETTALYGGMDYGRYTAGVLIGFDDDKCWILGAYESDPGQEPTVAQNCNEFRRINLMRAGITYCDPSATVALREYKDNGLVAKECPFHGENSVLPGIERIHAMISEDKLVVHPDAPGIQKLINEMTNYRWDPKRPGKPIKMGDHLPDALRYGIMGARPAGAFKTELIVMKRNPFYA